MAILIFSSILILIFLLNFSIKDSQGLQKKQQFLGRQHLYNFGLHACMQLLFSAPFTSYT